MPSSPAVQRKLPGKYDFALNCAPDQDQPPAAYGPDAAQPDAGPSILSATQDQLGLKLVPAKGPIETIVIDRLGSPMPNQV